MKVPEFNRCCFCFPLRSGIILFACINIIFLVVAVSWLFITTELQKSKISNDSSIEVLTLTILFSILGMGVILNFLLLYAAYQKDIAMLRLYNYYAVATSLAALVPTFFLLSRGMYTDSVISLFAIAMQCYVIVLVRSDVVRLEEILYRRRATQPDYPQNLACEDTVTLL